MTGQSKTFEQCFGLSAYVTILSCGPKMFLFYVDSVMFSYHVFSMLVDLAFIQLITFSVDSRPLFSFDYSATTDYGVIEEYNGTAFYELKRPNIQAAAFYCTSGDQCGTVFVDTGYISEKQSQTPKIVWQPQMSFEFQENLELTLTPSIALGGLVHSKACVDNFQRVFHCYYGTQPQLPLFHLSYDSIVERFERRFIRVENLEFTIKWTF